MVSRGLVMKHSRTYPHDCVLTIHLSGGRSVRGRLVRRTRREWVLRKHSIEMDGVFVESVTDRLCVPLENVELVEVRDA